jgi:rubrerythrin
MSTAYAAAPAFSESGDDDRVEIHCCGCGYGAVVARPPVRCPMCGQGTWRPAAGHALGRTGSHSRVFEVS